ncbi:MAG: Do family serine endopeptidase [Bauldia sp.]|nr:Do family serine endopeptidase [Bauldia sp.]
MTDTSNSRTGRSLTSRLLLGTAIVAGLGGAAISQAVLPYSPAQAEVVNIQNPIQVPGFADLVEQVSPAVVSVRVELNATPAQMELPFDPRDIPPGSPFERFFREFQQQMPNQNPRPRVGQGSGFIVSADGYVVTNNHVVDGASTFTVTMNDGTDYSATLVGTDERTDLALLKIEGVSNPDFTYVRFSDDDVRIGDWVVAVGNPFGLGGTVTAGIVSARGRQIGAGPYDDFLQIDAAVNRGNSGGPDFNLSGEVVGVNTAIFSPSGGSVGIAFAIPAATAEAVIQDLMDGGEVVRGWLGVQIQDINEKIAASIGRTDAAGALIVEPQPNGPAAEAGLQPGDAVLAVNGEPIDDTRDLATTIAGLDPGTSAALTVWRNGAETEINVTLGTLPAQQQQAAVREPTPRRPSAPIPSTIDEFGLGLAPAPNGEGVRIASVADGGEAALSGLEPGDVILAVGGTAVSTPDEVTAAIAAAKEQGLGAVLLRVQSGQNTGFVALSFERQG